MCRHDKERRRRRKHVPALDEILKVLTPPNPLLHLILQLRNRLSDDIRQEIDQSGSRLHLRAIGWKRETMLGDLEQGDAERPDVRGDGVRLTGDALGSHVVRRADEGVCVALCAEFAADSEIAEFDLAVAAEEDVGWFDVCSP